MTEHNHDDGDLDQRLSDGLAALHSALDRILDFDAGLADATLPGRTDALDRNLDSVVDLDAGLAAILPTRPATPPLTNQPAPERASSASALRRFADDLIAQPAHQRLRVRTWLPRTQLNTIRALASLSHRTREDLRSRARALAHALALVLDNAVVRARDLENAVAHARDLENAVAHARDLARVSVSVSGRAYLLNDALDFELELEDRLVRARDLDRTLANARVRALDLDEVLDLDRALDLAVARTRARARTHDTSPGHAVVHAFTAALVRDRGGDEEVEHELIAAVEIVEKAVSDVVGADLDGADLRGIPLEGVRWSSTTRWPPDWAEWVRRASMQVGFDLWEIRGGGLGVDEFVAAT